MKKLLILASLLVFVPVNSYCMPIDGNNPNLLNNQHMKQFNFSDLRKKIGDSKNKLTVEKSQIILLNSLTFNNNQAFTSEELQSLVSDRIGKKFSQDDLIYIRKTITDFYQNSGYISAKVKVSENEKTKGNILITVDEGSKDSIKIESLDDLQ